MSITLELAPDVERALSARAEQKGLSLDAYLREVMEREAGLTSAGLAPGEEKAQAFLAWADSFPDTPALSDEAVSRSSMYPDRL